MFDEHHQNDCDDNADRAVQEQHFVFAVVHDKSRDERGDCLRGHRCGVIVSGVLSDGFRGGKFGNHRERVDVCNDKTEARDKIKQREQYGGDNRFFAGVDKEENKEERNDRKSKAQHYGFSSSDFRRERADGNKRDCGNAHTHARDNGRHACRQVERFGGVDRKV